MDDVYKVGQRVEVVVEEYTYLGINVTFNGERGLVFHEDIFDQYNIGDRVVAYIKNIRPDGKLDLTFRKHGYRNFIEPTTDLILRELREKNGFLPFNDKSDPDEIRDRFHMSKTQFKQAIGNLFKMGKIVIKDSGIELV